MAFSLFILASKIFVFIFCFFLALFLCSFLNSLYFFLFFSPHSKTHWPAHTVGYCPTFVVHRSELWVWRLGCSKFSPACQDVPLSHVGFQNPKYVLSKKKKKKSNVCILSSMDCLSMSCCKQGLKCTVFSKL